MRILFLSSVFPQPYDDTLGIYCYHWCKALSAQHEVRVIAPRPWIDRLRSCPDRETMDQWEAERLGGLDVQYPTYYYPPKILRNSYGRFMWLSVRRRVRRAVADFRPECVLSYWVHPDGEVAVRAARLAGVPSVVIAGGSDLLLLPKDQGRRLRIHEVLQSADAVVTVCQDLKDRAVELGAGAEKVHVVHQGIDDELFTRGSRAEARRRLGLPVTGRILLWVGRMVPVKGLGVLLEACSTLRTRGVDFRLHLVGDGPLRDRLQEQVGARGLSRWVRLGGAVPHEQLPDWYRAADLTVLPSFSEGLPNVLRESLACGTPFVASGVGGVAEISGEAGNGLVPPGDAAALADAIARALTPNRPAMRSPPRILNWAESAEALLDVIRPLVPPGRLDAEDRSSSPMVEMHG